MEKQLVSARMRKFRFVDGFVSFGTVWICWDLIPALFLTALIWVSCNWHFPGVRAVAETMGVFDQNGSPKKWATEYLVPSAMVLFGFILWVAGWAAGSVILWIFAFLDLTRNTAISQMLFKNPPANEFVEVGGKAEPKPELKPEPKAESKQEEPKAAEPKAEPKKEKPEAAEPKAEPKKEKPEAAEPKAEPKAEEPKPEPKAEEPKADDADTGNGYVCATKAADVVEVRAGEGQAVTPKTVILILSSGRVTAGQKGVILDILVAPGQKIKKGDKLFQIG